MLRSYVESTKKTEELIGDRLVDRQEKTNVEPAGVVRRLLGTAFESINVMLSPSVKEKKGIYTPFPLCTNAIHMPSIFLVHYFHYFTIFHYFPLIM